MDSLDQTTDTTATDNPDLGAGTEAAPEVTSSTDEPTYTVKVAGEELEVPLTELVNGYSRQSDYTRKTQELATERERLAVAERLMLAFDKDPQRTLEELAKAYGVSLSTAQQMVDDASDEDLDPDEKRVRELEQQVGSLQQTWQERQIEEYIEQQYKSLETNFGDVDRDELAEYMIRHEIRDFEAAFKALSFDKLLTRARTDQEARTNKSGLPAVAGGHGVQAGAVVPGQATAPSSIRDAFMQAKQSILG